MNGRAQDYSIVVVDVEGLASSVGPVQRRARDRVHAVVADAFDAAGIDHRLGPPPVDRASGALWLLPGLAPKADLTGRFIDFLQAGLEAQARKYGPGGALRLRVALHYGEAVSESREWTGSGLRCACHLVELPALRDTLWAGRRSALAVAVSDEWHRAVLLHQGSGAEAEAHPAAPIRVGRDQSMVVWLRVPGYDQPPGLDLATADKNGGPSRGDSRKRDAVGIGPADPATRVSAGPAVPESPAPDRTA